MNLEQQVKHLDKHYRDGNPIVSDKKFDILEKKLYEMHPDSDYFTNRDALPLPSLEKDTIENFIEGLLPATQVMVQPKLDGCAVAIEYRDGILHKAITRKGKDITRKMINFMLYHWSKCVNSVPLFIPTKETVQVRGELYTKDVAGNISQRIAAGYLRSKSFDPNVNLRFCAFQIINSELDQNKQCQYLSRLNFHTTKWTLTDIKYLEEHRKNWINGKLWNNLPTDGIVVKLNDYKLQQTRPDYWQMAIKY